VVLVVVVVLLLAADLISNSPSQHRVNDRPVTPGLLFVSDQSCGFDNTLALW
jgi:hypothetical protein